MEAAGLASNILTFIDISFKLVRGTYEIYSSVTGATVENVHIRTVVDDLERAAGDLVVDHGKIGDLELVELAKNCQVLSGDLSKELEKLQARSGDGLQTLKAAKAAWAVMRKQKDVNSIEKRLESYRQQIMLRLNILICNQQSPIRTQLEELRKRGEALSNETAKRMAVLRDELVKTIQDVRDDIVRPRQAEEAEVSRIPRRLIEQIDGLKTTTASLSRENTVLHRLYFDSIFRREDAVHDPVAETFRWITDGDDSGNDSDDDSGDDSDDASDDGSDDGSDNGRDNGGDNSYLGTERIRRQKTSKSLMAFLRHEGTTFFVCGKAGCGKSTLMKFLGHDVKVLDALEGWAGDRKLVVVKIFFWSSDDPLQKSREGFYRSVLFHALRQCPYLLDAVFPQPRVEDAMFDAPYRLKELEAAFERLTRLKTREGYRFCYFIDGLDEHEGDNLDHRTLAKQLKSWAQRDEHVKIVCAARPHTVFLDAFKDSGITIYFHELTRSDILVFASSRFRTELAGSEFKAARQNCVALVEEISRRAEGVFVWASLVVRSLLNAALGYDDTLKSLRQRLEDCPSDLNTLFRTMLDNVDPSPSVRQRSNILLCLAVNNPGDKPLNALAYSLLEDLGWFQSLVEDDFPFTFPISQCTEDDAIRRNAKVRYLLHFLTQGLLEMVDIPFYWYYRSADPPRYFRHKVDFFHRTVRDYLKDRLGEGNYALPSRLTSLLVRGELYLQLDLAQAKIASRLGDERGIFILALDSHRSITAELKVSQAALFRYLREWENVIQNHGGDSADGIMPMPKHVGWFNVGIPCNRYGLESRLRFSYLHFACWVGQSKYVRLRLHEGVSLNRTEPSDPDLLVNACNTPSADLTRHLLSRGRRGTDLVEIRRRTELGYSPELVSVWILVVYIFASKLGNKMWTDEEVAEACRVLELYLEAGADPALSLLITPSPTDSYKPYRLELLELVRVLKPENLSSLEKLLFNGSRRSSSWGPSALAKNDDSGLVQESEDLDQFPVATREMVLKSGWVVDTVVSKHETLSTNEVWHRIF